MMIDVVYIEDDAELAAELARYLELHQVNLSLHANLEDGMNAIYRRPPDVILLAIDGAEPCRQLRSRVRTPIIIVSRQTEVADRVMGLEAGADDYVLKPFASRELLARIRAQFRRGQDLLVPRDVLVVGPLCLDLTSRIVQLDGRQIRLTSHEFDLLHALAEHPGRVLSRERLVEKLRGSADDIFERSIDVSISRLRHKLGDDYRSSRLLKTIRGIGYSLVPGRNP